MQNHPLQHASIYSLPEGYSLIGSIKRRDHEVTAYIQGPDAVYLATLNSLFNNDRAILHYGVVADFDEELECVCPECGESLGHVDVWYAIEWPKSKERHFSSLLENHSCGIEEVVEYDAEYIKLSRERHRNSNRRT